MPESLAFRRRLIFVAIAETFKMIPKMKRYEIQILLRAGHTKRNWAKAVVALKRVVMFVSADGSPHFGKGK